MKGIVEERAVELGEYIIAHKATVRAAAKEFGISKSTVHMDVSERLRRVDVYKRQIMEIDNVATIKELVASNLGAVSYTHLLC